MKRHVIQLLAGAALVVFLFFAKLAPDTAPVVSKAPLPSPTALHRAAEESSTLIVGLDDVITAVDTGTDIHALLKKDNPLVDLDGFRAALKADNYREAFDLWYQESLRLAEADGDRRASEFLTSPSIRYRFETALDVTTYSREVFMPRYYSGKDIDLDASLKPIIQGLPDNEQASVYKPFKSMLTRRAKLLQMAAKHAAERAESPTIEAEHRQQARQAFAAAMSKLSQQ